MSTAATNLSKAIAQQLQVLNLGQSNLEASGVNATGKSGEERKKEGDRLSQLTASDHRESVVLLFSASAKERAEKSSRSSAQITFELTGENHLNVSIETERLLLQSMSPNNVDNCCTTFCDSIVMEKYAFGKPYPREHVEGYVNGWVENWNNQYPFSGLAVFYRETHDFVGHVDLGCGGAPGTTVLAYLFRQKYWNTNHKQKNAEINAKPEKGYTGIGTEAVSAVVLDYAPKLKEMGYQVLNPNKEGDALEKNTFTEIVTTVRTNNIGSQRVLEHVGMKRESDEPVFLFNGPRFRYAKKM